MPPALLMEDAPPLAHAPAWQMADAASFASIPSFQKNSKLWTNPSLSHPDSPIATSVLHNATTDDASSTRGSGEDRSQTLQRAPGSAHYLQPSASVLSQCAASPRPSQQASPSAVSVFKSRFLFKSFERTQSPKSPKPPTDKEQECLSPVIPFHQAFDETQEPALPAPTASLSTPAELIMSWELELRRMIYAGNMLDEALDRPAPSAGMARCCVRRSKNFLSTNCVFQLHLQCSNQLLLAARKRKKSKVSAYVISTDADDLKRDSSSCIAKLKANWVGTEYVLWGRSKSKTAKKGFGSEQLCLSFKPSSIEGGPHAMHAVVPVPEGDWRPELSAERGSNPEAAAAAGPAPSQLSEMLEQAKQRSLGPTEERQLALMSSKPPEYDEANKEFFLDFAGRVKLHSVKNMQLVCWNQSTDTKGSQIVMQFGKVAEDHYILDFAYPLTVKTAFGLALAKLDTKLCYMLG